MSPSKDTTKLLALVYMPTLGIHFGMSVDAAISLIGLLSRPGGGGGGGAGAGGAGKEGTEGTEGGGGGSMSLVEMLRTIKKDERGRISELAFLRCVNLTLALRPHRHLSSHLEHTVRQSSETAKQLIHYCTYRHRHRLRV